MNAKTRDFWNEPDPILRGLRYIAESPAREFGGFHPEATKTAKAAIEEIERLRRETVEECAKIADELLELATDEDALSEQISALIFEADSLRAELAHMENALREIADRDPCNDDPLKCTHGINLNGCIGCVARRALLPAATKEQKGE